MVLWFRDKINAGTVSSPSSPAGDETIVLISQRQRRDEQKRRQRQKDPQAANGSSSSLSARENDPETLTQHDRRCGKHQGGILRSAQCVRDDEEDARDSGDGVDDSPGGSSTRPRPAISKRLPSWRRLLLPRPNASGVGGIGTDKSGRREHGEGSSTPAPLPTRLKERTPILTQDQQDKIATAYRHRLVNGSSKMPSIRRKGKSRSDDGEGERDGEAGTASAGASSEPSDSSSSALASKDLITAGPYLKMLCLRVPPGAVRHKMIRDSVDPNIIRAVVGRPADGSGGGETPGASETGPILTPEESISAAKYRKMRALKIPDGAVMNKMKMDGVGDRVVRFVMGGGQKSGENESAADPAVGGDGRNAKSRGRDQRQRGSELLSLHWTPLTGTELGDSVWSSNVAPSAAAARRGDRDPVLGEPDGGDMTMLHELFQKKKPATTGAAANKKTAAGAGGGGRVVEKARLLDLNRSNNVEILLKAFKEFTIHELADTVRFLDPEHKIRGDRVKLIGNMLPTDRETRLVRSHRGGTEALVPAELWFLRIGDVERVNSKLRAMTTMESFSQDVSVLVERFQLLREVCAQVVGSEKLRDLLGVILQIGNIMNEGTRSGGAAGFKFESLLKLTQTKGTDGKTTVLDFLVAMFVERDKRAALDLSSDFSECQAASRLPIQDMLNEVMSAGRDLEACRTELQAMRGDVQGDPRPLSEVPVNREGEEEEESQRRRRCRKLTEGSIARLEAFLVSGKPMLDQLREERDSAIEACGRMAKYCAEGDGPEATGTLLSILAEFAAKLRTALDRYDERARAEERKRKQRKNRGALSSSAVVEATPKDRTKNDMGAIAAAAAAAAAAKAAAAAVAAAQADGTEEAPRAGTKKSFSPADAASGASNEKQDAPAVRSASQKFSAETPLHDKRHGPIPVPQTSTGRDTPTDRAGQKMKETTKPDDSSKKTGNSCAVGAAVRQFPEERSTPVSDAMSACDDAAAGTDQARLRQQSLLEQLRKIEEDIGSAKQKEAETLLSGREIDAKGKDDEDEKSSTSSLTESGSFRDIRCPWEERTLRRSLLASSMMSSDGESQRHRRIMRELRGIEEDIVVAKQRESEEQEALETEGFVLDADLVMDPSYGTFLAKVESLIEAEEDDSIMSEDNSWDEPADAAGDDLAAKGNGGTSALRDLGNDDDLKRTGRTARGGAVLDPWSGGTGATKLARLEKENDVCCVSGELEKRNPPDEDGDGDGDSRGSGSSSSSGGTGSIDFSSLVGNEIWSESDGILSECDEILSECDEDENDRIDKEADAAPKALPARTETYAEVSLSFLAANVTTTSAGEIFEEALRILRPGGVVYVMDWHGSTVRQIPRMRRMLRRIVEVDGEKKTRAHEARALEVMEKNGMGAFDQRDPEIFRWMGVKQ